MNMNWLNIKYIGRAGLIIILLFFTCPSSATCKTDTVINTYKRDSLYFAVKADSIIAFHTGDSLFTIIKADTVLPVIPKAVKRTGYDNRVHRFRKNWERIIPTPEPSLFYLKAFIERMVELARHQNPCDHITFHTKIDPADLILHADENLISQVVINLLKNAIQAIGDQPDGQIDIQVYCNETEEVLIEIKNNGPVIPPEIVEHIFIPFFTTKEGGSGIGLSISRQIMRLSGGSLTLLPDNKETKFILKFK